MNILSDDIVAGINIPAYNLKSLQDLKMYVFKIVAGINIPAYNQ